MNNLTIHYNSLHGQSNSNYEPVCSKGLFTLLPNLSSVGFLLSMIVSKKDCVAAGLSVRETRKWRAYRRAVGTYSIRLFYI